MASKYLDAQNTKDFVSLHFPALNTEDAAAEAGLFRAGIDSGKRSDRDFILIYDDSKPVWSFLIHREELNNFAVQCPKYPLPRALPLFEWTQALGLLKARLSELGAGKTLLRFTKSPETSDLSQALEEIGFRQKLERIEFKTQLSELPEESDSPFDWKAVDGVDITMQNAADVMELCAAGDPNWDSRADVHELLKNDLAEEDLYHGLDSIHVGYINSEPVAFVFAQVNQSTGWSKLGYLGLVPKLRGKGFGKAVQLHGFSMMRKQGGIEYHGGTTVANERMLGTFKSLGSKQFRAMEDWELIFSL